MKSKFSKADLKDGDELIRRRKFGTVVVKGKSLVDKNDCVENNLLNYNEDLTHEFNIELDIVKVTRTTTEVLFERKEVPEFVELPEYVELLKDFFGYKKGDIAKVLAEEEEIYDCFVPNRESTGRDSPNVWYSKNQTNPATKQQFEAQQAEFNKIKELIDGQIYVVTWTDKEYKHIIRAKGSELDYHSSAGIKNTDGSRSNIFNINSAKVAECAITTLATPEQSADLVRDELDHGWYWNGIKLIKIK